MSEFTGLYWKWVDIDYLDGISWEFQFSGTDPKYLTTVIPYHMDNGPPDNQALQALIKSELMRDFNGNCRN